MTKGDEKNPVPKGRIFYRLSSLIKKEIEKSKGESHGPAPDKDIKRK